MDFLNFMKENELMITNYNDMTIIDVVRTLYNLCGATFDSNPKMKKLNEIIESRKHFLLILSDGMGSNLIDSLPDNSILKRNKKMDIQTVNPSTTGCAIPSIVTGEYPEIHGLLGWLSYYREKEIEYLPILFTERKSNKNLEDLGISTNEIFKTKSMLNNLNRNTYALFPDEIKDSSFSKFILSNGKRYGYNSIKDAFSIFTDITNKENLETFTFMYLPQVDHNSHEFGVYSDEVYDVINTIENQLKEIDLNDEIEVIIIADHGQTDVIKKGYRVDGKKYRKFFYALPGIDSGTATYYVKKEQKEEFEKNFKHDFKDKMFLFRTEELIKNKIFGPNKLSDYMKSNLGEYISICKKGEYFINSEENDELLNNLKGTHSGFSKDEIITPLIILSNRKDQ